MSDAHLLPPEQDLQWAREVEAGVAESDKAIYLEYMNNRPFSVRVDPRDIRDGCILTGLFVRSLKL